MIPMPQSSSRMRGIFRGLTAQAARSYHAASDAGLISDWSSEPCLSSMGNGTPPHDPPSGVPTDLVLEARKVPVVSYPYEWSFSMLRDAALLTLDITAACLRAGFQMKDATAYNVVFEDSRPVMIDITSVDEGFDGIWAAYGQFCDHFLAPLLLEARLGVPFQPYLRGRLTGLPVTELVGMFPGLRRFRRGVFSHVYLRSRIEGEPQPGNRRSGGAEEASVAAASSRDRFGAEDAKPDRIARLVVVERVGRVRARSFL